MGGVAFGGIVGAVACGFLGFAVLALSGGGWSFLFEVMGILFGGLGGAIAPLVAWADRPGPPRRGSARMRAWLLAFGPLLLGAAILFWRFGLFVVHSPNRDPVVPQATSPAAPPAPTFKPTTWWDVVEGNTAAAFAPTLKATHDAFFGGAFVFVLGLGLPIVFIAYGAFLGGRAVRFFPEHDGPEVSPPSEGPEEPAIPFGKL